MKKRINRSGRRSGASAGWWMLCGLCALPGGCGPSAEVRRWNQVGLRYYHEGKYIEAITAFKSARHDDRETPEPGYYTGRCYLALADQNFQQDNLVTALRYCDKAIYEFTAAYEAFPGYTNALEGKAEALKRKGKHQSALELADWAVAMCGPHTRLLIFRAREYAQHGDPDEALRVLQQAVDTEPNNAATHAELGRFHMRMENRQAAIDSLRRALQLDPNVPGAAAMLQSLQGG